VGASYPGGIAVMVAVPFDWGKVLRKTVVGRGSDRGHFVLHADENSLGKNELKTH